NNFKVYKLYINKFRLIVLEIYVLVRVAFLTFLERKILSYEVSLIIIQIYVWYRIMVMHLFLIFLLRIIAELNHRPIDFVEGESELVSGFNIEYFRGGFALIFMTKYDIIIFLDI
ncbi:NU1M oxidoreductase, partial [Acromyrmex insinuator]